jgi:predicted HAD superfamily phosphohydrolase YqeG
MARSVLVDVGETELLLTVLIRYRPVTLVLDVQPLVVDWQAQSRGFPASARKVAGIVRASLPSVTNLVFATNSNFPRVAITAQGTLHILIVTRARKPWRTGYLQGVPRPVAVVGDQLLTDGLLAWRLGALFLHWHGSEATPWWPHAQSCFGHFLQPLFFRSQTNFTGY